MFNIYEEEIVRLSSNIELLKQDIKAKTLHIKELTSKHSDLEIIVQEKDIILEDIEIKYKNLLNSKGLSSGLGGKAQAKAKINTLVREIDKCIALLND